jgi:hypothetical protein
MAEIDVGDAAMAGVRTIMRQPFSVLAWGLLMAILVGLLFVSFGGGIASTIGAMIAAGPSGVTPAEVLSLIGGAFGFLFLLIVGVQLLDVVLRAAAIRAVLEPDAHNYAYMRVGGQEGWLLAASLVFWLVLLGANIAMNIPLGILAIASTVGSIAAGSQGSPDFGAAAGFVGLRIIGQLIIAAVSIWLWLRLSLGVVATFHERQFRLFESWAMTRGHVLRIFLTMLLVVLMLLAIYIVFWVACLVTLGVTIAGVAGHDPRAFFNQPPSVWLGALIPLFTVFLIGIVVNVGVGNALIWGAVARMWRQLNPDAEAAKAFA